MKFPELDKDCALSKEAIISMYNELLEYQYNTELALDAAHRKIDILEGRVEDFPLE